MGNKVDPTSVPIEAHALVGKANIEHKYMITDSDEVMEVL